MKSERKVTVYNSTFVGLTYFLTRPKLWLLPLMGMLIVWVVIASIFLFTSYYSWPQIEGSHLKYSLKILQSLAIASVCSLLGWIVLTPVILTLCFEHLLKKVYLLHGDAIESISLLKSVSSSCSVFIKTIGMRLIWVVIGFVLVFILTPLSPLVLQIAISHFALIDGCDLSLALRGKNISERVSFLKKNKFRLFFSACILGCVGVFLMPTMLIWMFWIPSIYIGMCLWVRQVNG